MANNEPVANNDLAFETMSGIYGTSRQIALSGMEYTGSQTAFRTGAKVIFDVTGKMILGADIAYDAYTAPSGQVINKVISSSASNATGWFISELAYGIAAGAGRAAWGVPIKHPAVVAGAAIIGGIAGGVTAYYSERQYDKIFLANPSDQSVNKNSELGFKNNANGTTQIKQNTGLDMLLHYNENGKINGYTIGKMSINGDGTITLQRENGTVLRDNINNPNFNPEFSNYLNGAKNTVNGYLNSKDIPLSIDNITSSINTSQNNLIISNSGDTASIKNSELSVTKNKSTDTISYEGLNSFADHYSDGSSAYGTTDPVTGASIGLAISKDGAQKTLFTADQDGNVTEINFQNTSELSTSQLAAYNKLTSVIQEEIANKKAGLEADIDAATDQGAIPEEPKKELEKGPGSEKDIEDRAEEDPERREDQKEGLDNSEKKASPLILDLNKNGQIDLVSKANSHAYFDLTGDHMAEHTGWVNGASGDGLLVWDRNNDGKINSINELFGSQTEEGFAKLALLDSNADGKMSSADANWSKLKLWVDANSNGITEAGELKTLASYQIASINLANTRVMQTVEGNTITNDGLFTYANGTTGKISDIWFAYDPWNTVYNNNYTLDLRALFLPSIRGYGEIADLHIEMSLENGAGGLLEKVEAFAAQGLNAMVGQSFAALKGDIYEIMYDWADVEGVAPGSRGAFVDARQLAYLEKMTGEDYYWVGPSQPPGPNPPIQAGLDIGRTFFEDSMYIAARLAVQGAAKSLFTGTLSYDLNADAFTGAGALNTATLSQITTLAKQQGACSFQTL